jgi:AmmeMemoRadiSam system protein A
VVGYLSAAFINNKNNRKEESVKMEGLLNHTQKKELINIARKTLNQYIKKGETYQPEVDDLELKKDMGAFVTLRKNGNLRGCIGNIIAKSPLYIGVRDMAIAASTQDPRFPPVDESELDSINLEISVLSPLEKIDNPDKIILGKHGVLVRKGLRSGVFLPQVADETGWNKEEFMNNLCVHKAGLEPTCWKTGDCDIFIFSAEVFEE